MNTKLSNGADIHNFLPAPAAGLTWRASKCFLGLLLAAGATATCGAQEILASGQLSDVPAGGGTFTYTLVVGDGGSATSPIGTVWFGWTPGENYLISQPSSIQTPTGWGDTIVGGAGAYSIQFVASSTMYDINAGSTMTFGFTSADSPSVLAEDTINYSDHNPITTTFAYEAGPFSGASEQFVVSVPEPSVLVLAGMGCVALGMVAVRRLLASA